VGKGKVYLFLDQWFSKIKALFWSLTGSSPRIIELVLTISWVLFSFFYWVKQPTHQFLAGSFLKSVTSLKIFKNLELLFWFWKYSKNQS
jgi:hypothetical protein